MIIMQRTGKYDRSQVRLTREGLTFLRQRPKVGGGYYNREVVTCPWPWKKVT